jgi:flagellar biosynthetic protein FliR
MVELTEALNTRTLDYIWVFMLLLTRHLGLFLTVPGLGSGATGIAIRIPAIIALSFSATYTTPPQPLPNNVILLVVALVSEVMFGSLIGFIPRFIVAGVQGAGQLASMSMGLNAGQMFDPSSGGQVSDIGRILGDLTCIMFLVSGGAASCIYTVSGLNGIIVPGSFIIGGGAVKLLIERSSEIFSMMIIFSSPIVVALLLTQLVMGLISRAVTTINVFIISFPLTVGIGLLLLIICLRPLKSVIERHLGGVDESYRKILESSFEDVRI